jgi:hypothetical protein
MKPEDAKIDILSQIRRLEILHAMSEYDEAESQAMSLSALVNDDSVKVLEGDRRDLANEIQGLIT